MILNWAASPLADGLHCYNTQQYFAAHEHWESVWLNAPQPDKLFLQAIIQVTVAMHHFTHANLVGATRLFTAALRKLEAYADGFGGIDVNFLRDDLRTCLLALAEQPCAQLAPPRVQPVSL